MNTRSQIIFPCGAFLLKASILIFVLAPLAHAQSSSAADHRPARGSVRQAWNQESSPPEPRQFPLRPGPRIRQELEAAGLSLEEIHRLQRDNFPSVLVRESVEAASLERGYNRRQSERRGQIAADRVEQIQQRFAERRRTGKPAGGVITELQTFFRSQDPHALRRSEVRLSDAQVQRVLNSRWIMIGDDREQQVLVRLPFIDRDLRIGDFIKLSGVVERLPGPRDRAGLTQAQAELAEQPEIFIEATRVQVLYN